MNAVVLGDVRPCGIRDVYRCCRNRATEQSARPLCGQPGAQQSRFDRVYNIDAGHRLLKTIQTVPDVRNVKGVAASAVTGKLYVSYHDRAGVGMVYCLDLENDTVLWNRKIDPGADRLAISPDGGVLYVPTGEDNTADHINVVDANTGAIVRKVYFSKRSHDTQYPLSGPLFQETKAEDGSGNYLYQIDPKSYAVSSRPSVTGATVSREGEAGYERMPIGIRHGPNSSCNSERNPLSVRS